MLYTHYCTVGKYSLHQPESLVCFLWGGFLARAIDQILSRVDLRFFLPPSLPPYYSQLSFQPSHLNVVSASPVIILGDLDSQFSFFFFFRAGYSSPHEYTTYTYNPIFRDTKERESKTRRGPKKRKKEKKRASSCLPYSNQNIHTHIRTYLRTYLTVGSNPPVRIQKSIV